MMDNNSFNQLPLQTVEVNSKPSMNQSIDREDRKRKLLVQDRQVVGLSKISWYVLRYKMLKEIATAKLLHPYFKHNRGMYQ